MESNGPTRVRVLHLKNIQSITHAAYVKLAWTGRLGLTIVFCSSSRNELSEHQSNRKCLIAPFYFLFFAIALQTNQRETRKPKTFICALLMRAYNSIIMDERAGNSIFELRVFCCDVRKMLIDKMLSVAYNTPRAR